MLKLCEEMYAATSHLANLTSCHSVLNHLHNGLDVVEPGLLQHTFLGEAAVQYQAVVAQKVEDRKEIAGVPVD